MKLIQVKIKKNGQRLNTDKEKCSKIVLILQMQKEERKLGVFRKIGKGVGTVGGG